jgi:hypothetical protein
LVNGDNMTIHKFLIVVGEDVAGHMTFPAGEKFDVITDAFNNGYSIIEVPIDTEVAAGWKYNGESFSSGS